MKKAIIVGMLCVAILLSGCQREGSVRETHQQDAPDSSQAGADDGQAQTGQDIPTTEQSDTTPQADEPIDMETYATEYIEAISLQRMDDFASPSDIPPDSYVNFFMTANYDGADKMPIPEGYRSEVGGELLLPAADVEMYVTRFFDVAPDTLRTAQAYESEREVYVSTQNFGLSSVSDVEVTSAEQDGNTLDLIFDVYITMAIGEGDPVTIGPTTTRNARFLIVEGQDFKVQSLTTLFQADMDELMSTAGLQ